MITEEIAVFPEIAQRIVDLQAEYNLPINVTVGGTTDSCKILTLEYEHLEDVHLKAWIINRATNSFLREQGVTDEDLGEEDDYEE